jgi:hypothetical protein
LYLHNFSGGIYNTPLGRVLGPYFRRISTTAVLMAIDTPDRGSNDTRKSMSRYRVFRSYCGATANLHGRKNTAWTTPTAAANAPVSPVVKIYYFQTGANAGGFKIFINILIINYHKYHIIVLYTSIYKPRETLNN